jgi:hypothetical protein
MRNGSARTRQSVIRHGAIRLALTASGQQSNVHVALVLGAGKVDQSRFYSLQVRIDPLNMAEETHPLQNGT